MVNILVVEDDENLNKIICAYLSKNNYHPCGCKNPLEAYDILYEEKIDFIISDIMMPKIDGFEFLKTIRKQNPNIPVLFITALDDFSSKAKGYNYEVDDYMVKPLDLDELGLHVGALLRRAKIKNENTMTIGSLTLVRDEMSAYVDGEEVPLLPREFNVLFKLLSHPKKIFTRSELVDEYWGLEKDTGLRTVDVYITKLRNKFSKCKSFEIVTVHGFGYKAVIAE